MEEKDWLELIIEGIFAARSELVAVMDCDLQHDETKLRDMLDLFSKDASLDIVIGSRFTADWRNFQ